MLLLYSVDAHIGRIELQTLEVRDFPRDVTAFTFRIYFSAHARKEPLGLSPSFAASDGLRVATGTTVSICAIIILCIRAQFGIICRRSRVQLCDSRVLFIPNCTSRRKHAIS